MRPASTADALFDRITDKRGKSEFDMRSNKKLFSCAVCLVLAGALAVPALAHGHHGGRHDDCGGAASPAVVCPVEDCQLTGTHSHDGTEYCGHTRNDGHSHHSGCTVDGCGILRKHTHVAMSGHHGCRR